MAYVVVRPRGRFEIRESVHTPKGPRARSLANYAHFTDEVLDKARRRATRPFDAGVVRAAAARLGGEAPPRSPRDQQSDTRRFVEASRRMARSLAQVPAAAERQDPGDALIELLGLVAQVGAFGPARKPEPLRFPPLARLRAARPAGASD